MLPSLNKVSLSVTGQKCAEQQILLFCLLPCCKQEISSCLPRVIGKLQLLMAQRIMIHYNHSLNSAINEINSIIADNKADGRGNGTYDWSRLDKKKLLYKLPGQLENDDI